MKYIKISNVLIINDRLLPTHLELERDNIRPDFNLNTNYSSRHRHDKSRTEKKCLPPSEWAGQMLHSCLGMMAVQGQQEQDKLSVFDISIQKKSSLHYHSNIILRVNENMVNTFL